MFELPMFVTAPAWLVYLNPALLAYSVIELWQYGLLQWWLVILLAAWFALSLLVGNLASERGRDRWGWTMLSLVTSPLLSGPFLLVAGAVPGGQASSSSNWRDMADDFDQNSGQGQSPPRSSSDDDRFNPFA